MYKKIVFIGLLSGLFLASCGGDEKDESKEKESTKKETKKDEAPEMECTYTFVDAKTEVNWVGFKHSTRVAVRGLFRDVQYKGEHTASDIQSLIGGIEGFVVTRSVWSNDTTRDRKLRDNFFSVLTASDTVSARVSSFMPKFDDEGNASGECMLALNFNGRENLIGATYTVKNEEELMIEASLSLNEWKAEEALASIHEVCSEKHTLADDGEAITHEDVKIELKTRIEKNCVPVK